MINGSFIQLTQQRKINYRGNFIELMEKSNQLDDNDDDDEDDSFM